MTKRLVLCTLFGLLAAGHPAAQEPWTLERCLDYAAVHNLQLREQEAVIDMRRTDLRQKQAALLPSTLDAREGLTSSQVNCILKDSRGYVWFGTPAGLYRFDGYTFRNFQSDSQDGSSLNDSYINSIQEMLDGNLLVETSSGYCIYHPQTETFERDMKQTFARMGIETIPSIVYIDRHKNLWGAIPNKGVVCYNQQQQLLYEFGYTNDAQGIPQGVVCSISECRDGAVIVYDDGKLVCCDVMHQQHTVWATEGLEQLKNRRTKSLRAFADQQDNIWLYGQGTLYMYNKSANLWDTNIGPSLGLTGYGVDRNINGMAGDRSGNICRRRQSQHASALRPPS